MSTLTDLQLVEVHRALCYPARMLVLRHVIESPGGVSFQSLFQHLSKQLGSDLAEVTMRYHVYQLRDAGLITEKVVGRDKMYEVNLNALKAWVHSVVSLYVFRGAGADGSDVG